MSMMVNPYRFATGAGGDPHWANVVLLCGFEGPDASTSFVDESSFARALTVTGDAQIDTAQFKYGEASAKFDGAGDYVAASDSTDLEFGADPFTVECFVRFLAVSSYSGILSKRDGSSSTVWGLRWSSSTNAFGFYYGSTSVSVTLTPTIGTWYHLAVDYDGSRLRFYLDGTMSAYSDSYTSMTDTVGQIWIGSVRSGLSALSINGHLDEVRITKGVARYATDGSFAVPTEAFPRS